MSFLLHYPIIELQDKTVSSTVSYSQPKITFTPIVTWISSRLDSDQAKSETVPVIFIACTHEAIPSRLQKQCVSGNWDVGMLKTCPARIFVDLEMIFAEWSGVWDVAMEQLNQRSAQVYGETEKIPVLELTRSLHRDTANVISLQEDLRLHWAALLKYQDLIWQPKSLVSELVGKGQGDALEDAVGELSQNLQHQRESSTVIHKQLENLLSLVLNISLRHFNPISLTQSRHLIPKWFPRD
jgi:hypothetical protein